MGEEGSIETRVREIAERAARERGLELVHVEFAGGARAPIVRVFIDKPGGVTHETRTIESLDRVTLDGVEHLAAAGRAAWGEGEACSPSATRS